MPSNDPHERALTERRRATRIDTLSHLVQRQPLVFVPRVIVARINAANNGDYTQAEVEFALAEMLGYGQVRCETQDGEVYYGATDKGVRAYSRFQI